MTADTIQAAIRRALPKLPARVDSFRVQIGVDSTNDPAVYVILVLDDAELERIWPERDVLRSKVAEVVRKVAGSEYWPQVTFQATSEQAYVRAANQ